MRMNKQPTIKIPYYEIVKNEKGEVIGRQENHGRNGTDYFGSNEAKAERKEQKKMVKFYTRQAKRKRAEINQRKAEFGFV